MIVKKQFVGVVGGKEKTFKVGDALTEKEIKEMGMAKKPDLAKRKPK